MNQLNESFSNDICMMKKPKNLWIAIILIIAANIFVFLFQPGGDVVLKYVSDLLPVFCSLMAAYYLLLAIRSLKELDITKFAWLLIFIGIVFYFIAESAYASLEIALKTDMNELFPSVADYFWCVGYIPFFAGLLLIFIGYKRSGLPMGTGIYIGITFLVFLVSVAIIYFLLIPVVKDEETDTLAKIFYLYYPIADLLIVLPAIILIYITSLFGTGKITRPWVFLAFGFLLFTIADLLYSYLSWQDLYGNGNLIDVAWNAGYLFLGMSGLYQYQLVKSLKMS